MKPTRADLEMFAARIRPHFEPPLREEAYRLALRIAEVVDARVKDLRPHTTLVEIAAWLESPDPGRDSLDTLELSMALEEEFALDAQGPTRRLDTFRDLVVQRARRRAA